MAKDEDLKRILICGGRELDERKAYKVISKLLADRRCIIIQGDARGGDAAAKKFALMHSLPLKSYPADWKNYGPQAGLIRNSQMLVDGKPDVVIALPGGPGTANMVKQAKEAGVRVKIISTVDFEALGK